MTEWRALTGDEMVELARRLRSLDWSWRMDDVPGLAAAFDWRVLMSRPDVVRLDTGFGRSSGRIIGMDGNADDIKLRVTDFADEDAAGRARVLDAFATSVAALTNALGAPTARIPGESAEVRWAGAETTLVLMQLGVSLQLSLITNAELARHDRAVEYEGYEGEDLT